MIGIIAAVSVNGVIGQDNKIPFDYSEDLKHFKNTTINCNIIMGRKTLQEIGRALPKRRNLVVSSTMSELELPGTYEVYKSVDDALAHVTMTAAPIWFIGGASIYQEGLKHADVIILTLTPDIIEGEGLVRFPWINPNEFLLDNITPMETDTRLQVASYHRKKMND